MYSIKQHSVCQSFFFYNIYIGTFIDSIPVAGPVGTGTGVSCTDINIRVSKRSVGIATCVVDLYLLVTDFGPTTFSPICQ